MEKIIHCLCEAKQEKKLFQSGDYSIVKCDTCQQVRTEAPNNIKRKNFYGTTDIALYVEKEAMFRQLFSNVIAFIKRFVSFGKLVDIGAGVGLLVDEANKAGFDAIGFEPSKASVAAAKKQFAISLITSEFDPRIVKNGTADVVVLNHVLEHVEHPKKLLADVALSIRKNGFLFIGVPNFGSFMAYLKKGRWQSLVADQHRWHFTCETLDALVVPFGFRRVGERYENHDRGMHPWWKQPLYAILDTIALLTGKGEAMLVAYKKP